MSHTIQIKFMLWLLLGVNAGIVIYFHLSLNKPYLVLFGALDEGETILGRLHESRYFIELIMLPALTALLAVFILFIKKSGLIVLGFILSLFTLFYIYYFSVGDFPIVSLISYIGLIFVAFDHVTLVFKKDNKIKEVKLN